MAAKKYELDKKLEAGAVAAAVLDRRFYSTVGAEMVADCFSTPEARLLMKARHEVAEQTKGGVCSPRLIAQRLKAYRTEGKVTLEDCEEALDWLTAAQETGLADREGIAAAVVDVVRHHMNAEAIQKAMDLHVKRKPMSAAVRMFEKAARLGIYATPEGLDFDDAEILDRISTGKEDRLPTGIQPLDDALDGGTARGELGFCIGGTGDGKSMFLTQVTASALYSRRITLVITMELSFERWTARLLSAMTDVPIRNIMDADLSDAQKALVAEARALCHCRVVSMTPGVTTAADAWEYFDELNLERAAAGLPLYEVLVVDYADRFGLPDGQDRYEGAIPQYEGLRLGAVNRHVWCWTASAAKAMNQNAGGTKKKRRVEGVEDIAIRSVESAADSQNKSRVADVVVTLNANEGKTHTKVALQKNRNGEVGFVSALMETEYRFGRLTQADWIMGRGANTNSVTETTATGTDDLAFW